MNRALLFEVLMIIFLIILIAIVPTNNATKSLENSSLMQEHKGRMQSSQTDNGAALGNPDNTGGNQGNSSNENMLVSVSRAKGGYVAYENGTFVTPAPLPVDSDDNTSDDSDNNDDKDNNNGDGTASDSPDDNSTDGNSDDSDDGSNSDDDDNDKDDDSGSDFEWTLKNPETSIDTGKRATTTAPIKIRSTPTIQTENNVIDTLSEGEELVVTDASVTSTDPDITNWVEVYYKGQIGYISSKYVTVK